MDGTGALAIVDDLPVEQDRIIRVGGSYEGYCIAVNKERQEDALPGRVCVKHAKKGL